MDLEFPEIIMPPADAESARTEVAVAASTALDLSKIDLTDVALAQFGDWRKAVAGVKTQLAGVVHDLSTQAKIDEAKSLRFRLIGQPRADVRKVSTALKSKLAKVSKAIGAEEVSAVAAYDAAEKLITPQIEKREAEIAEEKRIAAEKEAARKQGHEDKLTILRGYIGHAKGLPSGRIAAGIEKVKAIEIDLAAWEEFAIQAKEAKASTLVSLQVMHDQAKESEDEAARIEAQRIENVRVAAEQAATAATLAAKQKVLDEQSEALRMQQESLAPTQSKVIEPSPMAGADISPAAELAAAKQSPEGFDPSPAAQALNEAEGAQRLAAVHPSLVRGKSFDFPVRPAVAPAASSVRADLNARLDKLSDEQLQRVLSFVKSRYDEAVAA